MISESGNNATQKRNSLKTSSDDQAYKIIVFGVAKDNNRTIWSSMVQESLQCLASYSVNRADAFHIEKFNANQFRPRPIIVKLRSVWDRRLVLSNARKLAEKPEFRRIGFTLDEPVETRRKSTMKCLLLKATNEGLQASIADNGNELYVNGDLVFTLRDGFTHTSGCFSNS